MRPPCIPSTEELREHLEAQGSPFPRDSETGDTEWSLSIVVIPQAVFSDCFYILVLAWCIPPACYLTIEF